MAVEPLEEPLAPQARRDWRFLSARLIEVIIGAVLLAAGLIKAYEPLDFIQQIKDYKLISAPVFVTAIAWALIALECALGAALITGFQRKLTIAATWLLFLFFLGTLGWAWHTGATADCGCFGSWAKRTPGEAFLEDAILLAAISAAWLLSKYEPVRHLRWRLAAVTAAVLLGITLTGFASRSSRQSSDPLVRLQAQNQQQSPFARLSIAGVAVDVMKGQHLISLIDTGCPHCRESVPALNQLAAQSSGFAPLLALCSNTPEDVSSFKQQFKAEFPVGRISYQDFTRLFERGKPPRILLVQAGAISKIWDGVVPTADEVKALLPAR
jgi:uncharacterized membrane protein YphA (DoxX/SURF4 family)